MPLLVFMLEAWSREEVEAAVGDYLRMLDRELRGAAYSKAEHNRQLQALLRNRTRGSIERKHQNISAILIELGYPCADARNRSLGRAGEELVLEFEHQRLWRAGKRQLADRIEHVARTQGDGLGFDIHSFELDGRNRLIEVKTTRFGALTPFFASRNEVEVSDECQNEFQLYRVFGFREQPRLFTLPGPLRQSCQLAPFSYSAVPN